jgi:hypothetical protein
MDLEGQAVDGYRASVAFDQLISAIMSIFLPVAGIRPPAGIRPRRRPPGGAPSGHGPAPGPPRPPRHTGIGLHGGTARGGRLPEGRAWPALEVIFDEDAPERLPARPRPGIWGRGGGDGRELPEAAVLRQWGGMVVAVRTWTAGPPGGSWRPPPASGGTGVRGAGPRELTGPSREPTGPSREPTGPSREPTGPSREPTGRHPERTVATPQGPPAQAAGRPALAVSPSDR